MAYRLSSILFILSILAYGLIQWKTSEKTQDQIIDGELISDFIAENLRSSIYSETGQRTHQIQADRMEHYPTLQLTRFELPFYTLYPKNSTPPWHVSAQEATLHKTNNVLLEDNVTISATEVDSFIERIECKTLTLDLNTNIITTDQKIIIYGKGFTIYGSGLMIDLNTTQMTLKTHDKTIYQQHAS